MILVWWFDHTWATASRREAVPVEDQRICMLDDDNRFTQHIQPIEDES